ncbi:O-antigen ligase family protein [Oceanicaulis sp.]|uniref:O-antigen ligase family protein n=1 Tax=Oceanicaulis sp. TaxID=1924941 RepID=UPI003D29426D
MSAFALADRWRATLPRFRFALPLEAGLAVFLIFMFSSALFSLVFGGDEEGSPVLRLIWPPVYLLTLILVLMRPVPVLGLMVRAWPLVILAALPMVSAFWSLDAGLSLRRGLGVLMPAVFGLWLASRYSWTDLIRLLALSLGVLAVGSLIMAVAFPAYGVMSEVHPGAWAGLWEQKNRLGAVMAIATMGGMAAALTTPYRREVRYWGALVILAVFLVLMSTSRTALMACMIGFGGPLMIYCARQGFIWAALAVFSGLLGVFALTLVIAIGPGVILEALGRDPTLTGRTDIWAGLIRAVADRPWTGFGWGVFWLQEEGPVHWVRQATQWEVPSAHNSWLEIALGLGVPGAALAFGVYLMGLGASLKRLFSGVETYWALPGMAIWGLTSMSESVFMTTNGFTWMLFCITFSKLCARRGS